MTGARQPFSVEIEDADLRARLQTLTARVRHPVRRCDGLRDRWASVPSLSHPAAVIGDLGQSNDGMQVAVLQRLEQPEEPRQDDDTPGDSCPRAGPSHSRRDAEKFRCGWMRD